MKSQYSLPSLFLIAGLSFVLTSVTRAQGHVAAYTVDAKSSLAWWQVNPNMKHLWATTCPLDPSWLPGEGRSPGLGIDQHMLDFPPEDTVHIPLLERVRVRPVCAEAVHGQLMTPDTATWKGVQGQIVVDAGALVTGENARDQFARKEVLETDKYPKIVFDIDRVVALKPAGDSITGLAVG